MSDDDARNDAQDDVQQDAPVEETADADGVSDDIAGGVGMPDAEEAIDAVADAAHAVGVAAGASPMSLPAFDAAGENGASPATMNLLGDVKLRVKVELGRSQMYVEDVLRLASDAVIELDKSAGDPVDIFVNDRHVARGEVLVLNENLCVRVSEIIQPAPDSESAS